MRPRGGGLIAAVAILVAVVSVPTAARPSDDRAAPVLVHGAGGSVDAALSALADLDLPSIHPMRGIGVAVTLASLESQRRLVTDARVEQVEQAPPPIEFLLDSSRRAIRLDDAATITTQGPQGFPVPYDGTGVTIAVIDSGIDGTHPMFRRPDGTSSVVRNLEMLCIHRVSGLANFRSCDEAGLESDQLFVDSPTNDTDGPGGGHGTHVASIAAGQRVTAADGRTLQGVAPGARLVGLAVTESGSTWASIAGLNWVVENHKAPCGPGAPASACPPIKVVNNSWGFSDMPYDPDSALDKAVKAVIDSGVAITWSAGNQGEDSAEATTNGATHAPTGGVISAASYNDGDHGGRDGYLSAFSSRGMRGEPATYPDLAAPGEQVWAACREHTRYCGAREVDTNYSALSGTSMAAPHVAGAVAVLLQANPALTPSQMERILEASAHKFRSRGKYEPDPANPGATTSYDKGHGLLDLAAALAVVTGRPNPPVSSYPQAYRPPDPGGAASLAEEYEWSGGPLVGPGSSDCTSGFTGRACERRGVALAVPDGGADVAVMIDPDGAPVGVELTDPHGTVVAGNYYVDEIGTKQIEATVFVDGVYTVEVWSIWGATPTYKGFLGMTEIVEE